MIEDGQDGGEGVDGAAQDDDQGATDGEIAIAEGVEIDERLGVFEFPDDEYEKADDRD